MPRSRALEDRQPATLFVGLGASAGGLPPLEQFFAHLPAHAGVVFVVVQHLEPHRPSLLAELLARHASMPVAEATDGLQPQADHVYVIAPGTLLTLDAGAFRLTPAPKETDRGPIDVFFRSLASAKGERAVAIVFSGAGHDGTAGLRAIKDQGGLTLAQAPDTAKHDSMPQSAIEAGLVDYVLPPEQLAAKVLEHVGHVAAAESSGTTALEPLIAQNLGEICALVRQHTGHDFANYKEGTLVRRIVRRMQVLHTSTVDGYLHDLEKKPGEADALVKDLLIGVTQFFRDPEAFQALSQQVIPLVVQGRTPDTAVRIWVAGCASGEEAYSIAILVREHLERVGAKRFVQVFATDLDAEMLAEARQGRHPASIAEQVGPERLARFFERHGKNYQALKELREMCIFSQHSVIRDPPFSQIDLVSCRNLLIYLSAELQKKLVPLFHYALRPGGFLFLGPSEGIAGSPELFETTDKRSRIFRRKETMVRPVVEFPLSARSTVRPILPPVAIPIREGSQFTLQQRANAAFERMTLDDYAPPSVVVNDRSEIVLVAGKTGRFFQPPAGIPSANVIDVVAPSLRAEVRLALQAASASQRRVVRDNVAVELEDGIHRVRLTVRPLPGIEHEAGLLAIVVQEHASLDGPEGAELLPSTSEQPAMERLEAELRRTRADLKTTVEDLEAANEELKSSNEELISTNEELQSANEELQTSKEELQSQSEELETVNTELRQKVEELGTANSDLSNLFASTEVATLFLDRNLRIAKFTPAATELFHLLDSDVGRPITDLAPRFDSQDAIADAREVLRTLTPVERQVRTADEKTCFIQRVLPYRTLENVIAGVVLTFVDVTELKRAEEALRRTTERERFLADTVENATTAFGVGAPDGRLLLFNRAFAELTGYGRQELEHTSLSWADTLTPPEWREKEAEVLAQAVRDRTSVRYEKEYRRKDGTRMPIELVVQPVFNDDGTLLHYRSFVSDITERKRAEEALRSSEERLRLAVEAGELGTWDLDLVTGKAVRSLRHDQIFGYGEAQPEWTLEHALRHVLPEDHQKVKDAHAPAPGKRSMSVEARFRRADGEIGWVMSTGRFLFDERGRPVRLTGICADITARKAEAERQAYLASFPEQNPNPIVEADREGRVSYANPAAIDLMPDLREKGSAHPWLSSWHELTSKAFENPEIGRPIERDVTVGGRIYHQVFDRPPGEGVIRVYSFDITERRRAEEALRESEQRFRLALRNAPVTVGVQDLDLRYTWASSAQTARPDEIVGHTDQDLFAPEEAKHIIARKRRVIEEGVQLREQMWLTRPSGKIFLDVTWEPVRDQTGRIVGVATASVNLTPVKLAEERFHAAVSSMYGAILFVSHEDQIEFANRAFCDVFHLQTEPDAWVGRSAGELLARIKAEFPEPDNAVERIRAIVAGGKPVRSEEVLLVGGRTFLRDFVPIVAGGTTLGKLWHHFDITALKKAEEALRASEGRFRSVLENSRDFIYRLNLQTGHYEYASPSCQEVLGYPAEEFVAMATDEAMVRIHPDDLQAVGATLARLEEDERVGLEYRFRVKTGEYRWISNQMALVRDSAGRPLYRDGAVSDINDRKHAEERLARNARTFSELVERAPFGIYIVDSAFRVAHMNEASQAGAFRNVRPIIGRPFGEAMHTLWPDAVAEEIIGHFRHTLESGEPYFSPRFTNRRADVSIVESYEWELHRIELPDGQYGVICYYFDSTELRNAEESVRRSREGLSRLAEASLAVMAKAGLGDMLQAVSEAALALTGARLSTCGHGYVSGQYVVGGSARAKGAPACPPGEMFLLDKGRVHMALVEGAESIRLTDGDLRTHTKWWGLPERHVPMRGLLGVRMLARNEKPNGMILVTDKEHGDFDAEDEALLKQLATVASLALQHVEARISLEESDRRKNQFLAMLSHELRNPLAPIRNSLYILDRAKPGGEQARRAQSVIDRQVGHMTRLVDDLLDVTRISRGKIQLQRERLDLCDLARRAVEDYREAFEQSHIALELSVPAGALWINADRTRMAQVIGNLLGNSGKFVPPGGKAILSVEGSRQLGQAIVRVRDTGIGIAPEMLPRVFEAFAQADTTLDRSKGGLGLGLAMVKGLVELHGGTASVESEGIGKGSEFTVRIPIDLADLPAEPPMAKRGLSGGSHRVLVIEDNIDAAESLREVLELGEHTVEVAFSGPEGIDKARGFGPDVVLCDIGLPGMDGYEVARTMRSDPMLRTARLVALTGYAAPEDVAKAREAGFDAHLAKPPALEALEGILGEERQGECP